MSSPLALAQQTLFEQPPTDLDIVQSEAKAAESQVEYYSKLIRKQATEIQQRDLKAKELANYWAAYIGEKN